MTGIIKFDDEHIVKFALDAENQTIAFEIIDPEGTYDIPATSYALA